MTNGNNSQHFEWDTLVPHLVHPLKVAIIEAMSWIDEPLSPRDLDLVLDDEFGVSLVAYHVGVLADHGALEAVGQEQVRGAVKTFYVLVARDPADSPLHCE
jgi:hypothetical protein